MENLKLIRLLGENDYRIFENIFREFEKAPFFERWSDKQILEAFRDFLTTGKIFCYDNKGLTNIQFGKKKNELLPYNSWGNFIYLSDVVVLENSRCKGIGSNMLDNLIEYATSENFDNIYFRTNLTGSMLEPLGLKRGFEVIRDSNNQIITDEVPFLRQSGIVETDMRKYLIKKL